MVEIPAREIDLISLISWYSASMSSMTSVTRASVRAASAPGKSVKICALREESSGSSARGRSFSEAKPATAMSSSVSESRRGLR